MQEPGESVSRDVEAVQKRKSETLVSLTCPSCAAALTLSDKSDRLIKCGYCGIETYLPDDLWRRLHPRTVSSPFYVELTGKPQWQRKEEREAQKRRERSLRRQSEREMLNEEVARHVTDAWKWIAGLIALLIAEAVFLGFRIQALGWVPEAVPGMIWVFVVPEIIVVWIAGYHGIGAADKGYDSAAVGFLPMLPVKGFPILGAVFAIVQLIVMSFTCARPKTDHPHPARPIRVLYVLLMIHSLVSAALLLFLE
jgi:ribosomal protein S27AE